MHNEYNSCCESYLCALQQNNNGKKKKNWQTQQRFAPILLEHAPFFLLNVSLFSHIILPFRIMLNSIQALKVCRQHTPIFNFSAAQQNSIYTSYTKVFSALMLTTPLLDYPFFSDFRELVVPLRIAFRLQVLHYLISFYCIYEAFFSSFQHQERM